MRNRLDLPFECCGRSVLLCRNIAAVADSIEARTGSRRRRAVYLGRTLRLMPLRLADHAQACARNGLITPKRAMNVMDAQIVDLSACENALSGFLCVSDLQVRLSQSISDHRMASTFAFLAPVRTESQMKLWVVVLGSASIAKKSRGSSSGHTKRSRDFSGNSGMP